MNAYDTIRSVLSQSLSPSVRQAFDALAELERAAAVVDRSKFVRGEICGCQARPTHYVGEMDCPWHKRGDGQPPPAPVAEIREVVVVTRPMCHGAWARFWSESNSGDSCDQAMRWLEAWRSELGPALGLVEIREPTPEECADIAEWFKSECEACCINPQESADYGRAIFDAVKIVMWPKEGL